ncbi:hypothetical protein R6Q57_019599 [Mikania cordata]
MILNINHRFRKGIRSLILQIPINDDLGTPNFQGIRSLNSPANQRSMFIDNDIRSGLTKMYEYSPLDGFVDVSEGLGSMIKSLASEPSIGLFYVQQHTHNALPNLVNLQNNIVTKTREISLHTEDSEDSITTVRSMADCGFPVVDNMIKDITKSLAIMRQPRKGLIRSGLVSGFGSGRSSSWVRNAWRGDVNDVKEPTCVYGSGKQKTADLKQEVTSGSTEEATNGSANAMLNVEEELPVSSSVLTDYEEDVLVDDLMLTLQNSANSDEFKDCTEAKFEGWLENNDAQHHE